MRLFQAAKNIELLKVVMKFATVGLINTLFSYMLFLFLFYIGVNYIYSSIISYVSAVILSFFLNKNWVFSSDRNSKESLLSKFILINIFSLICNTLTIYSLHEKMGLLVELSQICAVGVVMLINFIMYKKLFK